MSTTPLFTVPVIIAYLSKTYQASKSYSTLILTRVALKWLHSFTPTNADKCPLDSPTCLRIIESAKRQKPKIIKKVSVSEDMIKAIIDKYASSSANLFERSQVTFNRCKNCWDTCTKLLDLPPPPFTMLINYH